MDILFPYLQRPPGTPTSPGGPMITPVFKDARISAYDRNEKRFLILLKEQQKKQHGQARSEIPPQPAVTPHTTPEAEQHTDADGHLDIFV
ncbi:hypothetical protein [Rheinheimera sp.]|uniref:hypothetical protein n=1 Tax=Rheinheimera sp. TaxID=1869214 RepID=UPI00307E59B3